MEPIAIPALAPAESPLEGLVVGAKEVEAGIAAAVVEDAGEAKLVDVTLKHGMEPTKAEASTSVCFGLVVGGWKGDVRVLTTSAQA